LKVDTSRNLSEIEVRLISRVAELILGEWCSYWSSLVDLRPSIAGHEANGRFVQSSSPDTMMLVLGVTAWIGGEIMDEMQFAFPHYTLEPLIEKLTAQNHEDTAGSSAQSSALEWNPALDEVQLPLSVELPALSLMTRQISQLKVGDFIPLNTDLTGKVQLRIGGLPKFVGELGATNEHRAVKITAATRPPKTK
jgi:flagellar motor switch protein FliM